MWLPEKGSLGMGMFPRPQVCPCLPNSCASMGRLASLSVPQFLGSKYKREVMIISALKEDFWGWVRLHEEVSFPPQDGVGLENFN